MTVSIALSEDHEDLREGLRGFLEAQPDFDVVGEATDGLEALSLLEHGQPDILLLDLRMPTLNGLEVIRRTEGDPQTTKILVQGRRVRNRGLRDTRGGHWRATLPPGPAFREVSGQAT